MHVFEHIWKKRDGEIERDRNIGAFLYISFRNIALYISLSICAYLNPPLSLSLSILSKLTVDSFGCQFSDVWLIKCR